ncbi:MAG: spore germination protein [Clostridiales bacterium]|nr:spore germination protein [Clostridiales bacterium]
MYSDNGKISVRQFQILLILDILGVSIIVMPKYNALGLGNTGFVLVLGGGFFALVSVFLMCALSGFLNAYGFSDGVSRLMGRPLSRLVSEGLVVKLAFSLGSDLRIFSAAAKLWLLPKTPVFIISAVTLLPCLYGAFKGYETRARLGEILIFIILIPLALVYIPCLFKADYSSLGENISADKNIYIKGSLYNCLMFSGLEFLMLSFPYLNKPYSVKPAAVWAVVFAVIAAACVNFGAISLLGADLTASYDFPGVEVMDISVISKGKGAVIMSFFYLPVVMFAIGSIFFGGELIKDITGLPSKGGKCFTAFLGFVLSLIPENMTELMNVNLCFNLFFGTAYFFVLPIILNILLRFKRDEYDE